MRETRDQIMDGASVALCRREPQGRTAFVQARGLTRPVNNSEWTADPEKQC